MLRSACTDRVSGKVHPDRRLLIAQRLHRRERCRLAATPLCPPRSCSRYACCDAVACGTVPGSGYCDLLPLRRRDPRLCPLSWPLRRLRSVTGALWHAVGLAVLLPAANYLSRRATARRDRTGTSRWSSGRRLCG